MISYDKKELFVLQFAGLSDFPGLIHFSTTRMGGCSTDNYATLNLGFNSGDLPERVTDNRLKLCDVLGINPAWLVFPKQTHSATARIITARYFASGKEERKHFLNETDAVITNMKGVCLAIKTADCVPVLVYDLKQKVVAAIHAGWRGTVQGIVLKTINLMTEEFGSKPSDLFAGIGPSISPEVYEVGEEVWRLFAPEFYHAADPSETDKRLLDIWSANFKQLILAGVPPDQIEVAKICTFSDPDRFFSARRDGQQTGRMATGIMLR